ncbi:IS3 family transposase [Spiroplasma endosymbiont of 'Nebria riversi']|uniref:IS3 family transposase n=1 Tax=Spiroplasma endosymbiont of 'Nebria riversi' TaxID=2792084 RepID=UPI001C054C83|nr:IS3 family transposase [Spiroplasma endosymbiont of 'Nebria riversi']
MEFIKGKKFENLTQLKCELFDFVNWYNNLRIQGSLNYLTPVEFRKMTVYIKSVQKRVATP